MAMSMSHVHSDRGNTGVPLHTVLTRPLRLCAPVVALAALALASCDAPTASRGPRASLALGEISFGERVGAQVVFHDADSIVVTAEIRLPGIPYGADAAVELVGDALTLRLHAKPLPNCCADAINYRPYRVRLSGVRAEAATLRIVHTSSPPGWAPDTVLVYSLAPLLSVRRATP